MHIYEHENMLIFFVSHFSSAFSHFDFIQIERRPLKSTAQMPLFRSPSARLVQHDKLLADDLYSRGSDGSIVCSLSGINNKEVHHYTFQPSKQIVSIFIIIRHCFYSIVGFFNTNSFVAIVDGRMYDFFSRNFSAIFDQITRIIQICKCDHCIIICSNIYYFNILIKPNAKFYTYITCIQNMIFYS